MLAQNMVVIKITTYNLAYYVLEFPGLKLFKQACVLILQLHKVKTSNGRLIKNFPINEQPYQT